MNGHELTLDWNQASTPAQTVYHLRLSDPHDELLEAATLAAVMDSVVDEGGEFEAVFDALIVNAAKIETKAKQLGMAFARAAQSVSLVDNGVTVSQPFKQNGSTQIAMLFEMSDGQTITVYLHNPDVKPNQLQGDDVLVSWKWLLNRKDITIVVAKENGKDLALAQVASRIMALVDKNSARFSKANANRQARLSLIADLESQVSAKEATLKDLVAQLETQRTQPKPATPSQQVGDATLQFADFEALRAFLDEQAVDEHATPLSKASIVFQNGMSYALVNRSAWESGQEVMMRYELQNQSTEVSPHGLTPKTVDMDEAVQTLNHEVLAGDAKAVMLVLRDDDNETIVATRLVRGGKQSDVNKAQAELLSMAKNADQKYFMVHHIYATDYAYTAREKLNLLGYTVTERFDINQHIPDDVKSFLVVGQLYDLARSNGSGFYEGLRFTSYQVNYKYTDQMEVVAVFQSNSTHFEENVTRLSQKIADKQLVVAGSAPVEQIEPETMLPDVAAVIAPDTTPAADNEAAVFLQSVIDGHEDMTAADFAQRLTAMHEQTVGDEALTQLFNQAVEVYAAMAMAQAKQALGGA